MQRLRAYGRLATRAIDMARGTSYWHQPVGPGVRFCPGRLEGYYNDYRGKTTWRGPTDQVGLPLNRRADGATYVFPMTVFQKGLGHWDRWLVSDKSSDADWEAFLRSADWAAKAMDRQGGWAIWDTHGIQGWANPYSAMAQGQGISLLVRAWSEVGRENFLSCAEEAAGLMVRPVHDGGTAQHVANGLVLEEVPANPPNTVLNGWITALFGLHDLVAAGSPNDWDKPLRDTLNALAGTVQDFDAGFWSYYDSRKHIATPYYHARHIAQLTALEFADPDHRLVWNSLREHWTRCAKSVWRRNRALSLKIIQKLKDPPAAIVR